MKTITAIILLGLIVAAPSFVQSKALPDGQEAKRPAMLVSTVWLQDHLHDPGMIIFHVAGNRREYKEGHIPGARFLWTQALAYSDPDLTLELPSIAQADSVLKKLGVTEGVRIVLYFDNGNVSPATRVFYTFDYLGLGDHVCLLDGGMDAWKAEGRPLSSEIPEVAPGGSSPHLNREIVASCDWVRDNLKNREVTIVDARAPQFYEGKSGGMPRAGHIPGAVNIPFSSLVDSTNKLKDPATLRKIFQQAGVKPGSRVVSYCHIG